MSALPKATYPEIPHAQMRPRRSSVSRRNDPWGHPEPSIACQPSSPPRVQWTVPPRVATHTLSSRATRIDAGRVGSGAPWTGSISPRTRRAAPFGVATQSAPSGDAANATASTSSRSSRRQASPVREKSAPRWSAIQTSPPGGWITAAAELASKRRQVVPSNTWTPCGVATSTPPPGRAASAWTIPRRGAPGTAGTGVMSRPSKLATPSRVPIHKVPSSDWASAETDDCGRPRQAAFVNVRKLRIGVHSFSSATAVDEIARTAAASAHTQCPARRVGVRGRSDSGRCSAMATRRDVRSAVQSGETVPRPMAPLDARDRADRQSRCARKSHRTTGCRSCSSITPNAPRGRLKELRPPRADRRRGCGCGQP